MTGRRPAFYVLPAAAAGLLAGLFALRMGADFAELKLPLLFPPVWLLPFGWTAALILLVWGYSSIGDGRPGWALKEGRVSAGTTRAEHPDQVPAGGEFSARSPRGTQMALAYYVSLGLAVCWAAVFFRLDAKFAAALTGLLLTGVWLRLRRLADAFSPRAGKLITPCCVWAGYLAYLNLGIWLINRG
ncbi:MAG: tryptophan-rich sensory protein [Oscillospiraceae bacterium]|jgi:tryptophan-rich sensory protein|nr:tryptophan-rich sensory protein [Oscillospiraceae bacterium]